MKNSSKISIAVLIIAVALVAGFYWFNKGEKIVVSKPISTIPTPITTAKPQVPATPVVAVVVPVPGLPDTGVAPTK